MFYRDNAELLCLFFHVSSCFHDGPSDNPHMLHSNKMIQFLPLASLPWQPDSFLEPTFLLAYLPQSRGRRPNFLRFGKSIDAEVPATKHSMTHPIGTAVGNRGDTELACHL